MSWQRRHGVSMTVYRTVVTTDRRGNEIIAVDETNPLPVKGWQIPQRSARAEVPGQQKINVIRLGVKADEPDVNLWSRVEIAGKVYDFVTPPSLHVGTRHTRHWSIDLRERP